MDGDEEQPGPIGCFRTGSRGQKQLLIRGAPVPVPVEPGRIPRVARLRALAHRLRGLVEAAGVRDYADPSRLAGVTRARATQVLNLLHLAPDIQEAGIDLPRVDRGRDPVTERVLRPIAAVPDWGIQRETWRAPLTARVERVVLDVSRGPPSCPWMGRHGGGPHEEVDRDAGLEARCRLIAMETSHVIRGLAADGIPIGEARKVQVLGEGRKVLCETDLR